MSKSLVRVLGLLVCCFALFTGIIVFSLPSSTVQKNTICLNMFVKNDKDTIQKCLDSVKGLIHYWIIVDMGSTDGTQSVIKECMAGIPGELYQRPWVNFEQNKNEALNLAKNKAEYTLFINPDEVLSISQDVPLEKIHLDKDFYQIVSKRGEKLYEKLFLARNKLDLCWKGGLEGSLESKIATSKAVIAGIESMSDDFIGTQAKNPNKHRKEAQFLEKFLEKEPGNTHYQFCLAQRYAEAEEIPLALHAYKKRVAMGTGDPSEYFLSLYMIGRMQNLLGMPLKIIAASHKKAHDWCPWRPEPLFHLGLCYDRAGETESAYLVFKQAASLPSHLEDNFFIEYNIAWQLQHALGDVCWKMGKHEEAIEAYRKLISCPITPQSVRTAITNQMLKITNTYKAEQK